MGGSPMLFQTSGKPSSSGHGRAGHATGGGGISFSGAPKLRVKAAVDLDAGAGDVRAVGTGEVGDERGDFFAAAEALDRHEPFQVFREGAVGRVQVRVHGPG